MRRPLLTLFHTEFSHYKYISWRRLVMMGQQGEDLVVKVPPGVAITTDDGREIGKSRFPFDFSMWYYRNMILSFYVVLAPVTRWIKTYLFGGIDFGKINLWLNWQIFTANLNKAGDKFVVSKGGDGGGPHNDFKADKGVAQSIRIDLKLLADVGLVGWVL